MAIFRYRNIYQTYSILPKSFGFFIIFGETLILTLSGQTSHIDALYTGRSIVIVCELAHRQTPLLCAYKCITHLPQPSTHDIRAFENGY